MNQISSCRNLYYHSFLFQSFPWLVVMFLKGFPENCRCLGHLGTRFLLGFEPSFSSRCRLKMLQGAWCFVWSRLQCYKDFWTPNAECESWLEDFRKDFLSRIFCLKMFSLFDVWLGTGETSEKLESDTLLWLEFAVLFRLSIYDYMMVYMVVPFNKDNMYDICTYTFYIYMVLLMVPEIQRSPVEVGSLSRYFTGFGIHPRWLGMRFLPSTVFDRFVYFQIVPFPSTTRLFSTIGTEVYGSATQCMARDPGTTLELQLGVGIVNADKPMQLVPSGQDSDKIQKIENASMENETCLNSQHAVIDFGLVFLLSNPSWIQSYETWGLTELLLADGDNTLRSNPKLREAALQPLQENRFFWRSKKTCLQIGNTEEKSIRNEWF